MGVQCCMQSNTCLHVAQLGGVVDFHFPRRFAFDVEVPFRDGLRWGEVARVVHWDLFRVITDVSFINLQWCGAGDFLLRGPTSINNYRIHASTLHTDKAR